jgi:hypothetical protein
MSRKEFKMNGSMGVYMADVDDGPYVTCDVCGGYIIAPLGGRLCACHRQGKERREGAVSSGRVVIVPLVVGRLP